MEAAQFTHYVITRYNVATSQVVDKGGRTTLDDAWMADRLALFSKFLVPSVRGQSSPPFQWLVYCDRSTEEKYLAGIRNEVRSVGSGEVCLVDDLAGVIRDLANRLKSASTNFVITSRVDNDDALGTDYARSIHDHFIPEDKVLLNLLNGACYDMNRRVLTELHEPLNSFGTLIEKRNGEGHFLTIMGFPHDAPPAALKVVDVESRDAWLRVVHQRNILNEITGRPIMSGKQKEKDFNLVEGTLRVSLVNTIGYVLRRLGPWMRRKLMG